MHGTLPEYEEDNYLQIFSKIILHMHTWSLSTKWKSFNIFSGIQNCIFEYRAYCDFLTLQICFVPRRLFVVDKV